MRTPVRRAVVILPPTTALRAIEAVRAVYDPLALLMPAHLTLVFPFESRIPTADIVRHLQAAVAGTRPFTITLRGIRGSEGEYLFLNVLRGADALIALHDRLYTGLLAPYLSPVHPFVPHLTVGRLADQEAFRAALAGAEKTAESLGAVEVAVRALSSYLMTSDGPRQVECTVPLPAESPAVPA